MIKQLKLLLLSMIVWLPQAMAADNAIKMAYNFTTVSQNVVFNSAMQSGGTLQLSRSEEHTSELQSH